MSLAGMRPSNNSSGSQAARAGAPPEPQECREGGRGEREHATHEDDVGVPPHPAVQGLSHGRPISRRPLQLGEPVVDQVVAHVVPARIRPFGLGGLAGAFHRHAGDRLLGAPGALRDPLDHVAVPVARGERHAAVEPGRIVAQGRFQATLALDEQPPVRLGDGPQTGDAVGHSDLGKRQPPGRPGGRLLGAEGFVGDPVLEVAHGRERPGVAKLLEKASDEDRGQRRRIGEEALQLRVEGRLPRFAGPSDLRRRLVRRLRLIQPAHRAQGHPPHVLDESQPEHRRDGPELADGESGDLLKGSHEAGHVVERDPALAVRDQRDSQLVDPRIPGERPAAQHGQLSVVAPRQALAHLVHVLLDDVIVVQQPFARGADVGAAIGSGREPGVGRFQDLAGSVQPVEQRGAAAGALAAVQPLFRGERMGSLRQVLGAKQLTADGPGDEIFPWVGSTWNETSGNA